MAVSPQQPSDSTSLCFPLHLFSLTVAHRNKPHFGNSLEAQISDAPLLTCYLRPCGRFCLWELVTPTGHCTLLEHPQLIVLVKMKKEVTKMGGGEVAPSSPL